MNILFLTLLYPEETKVQTAAASRDGLQNQIDNYQRGARKEKSFVGQSKAPKIGRCWSTRSTNPI